MPTLCVALVVPARIRRFRQERYLGLPVHLEYILQPAHQLLLAKYRKVTAHPHLVVGGGGTILLVFSTIIAVHEGIEQKISHPTVGGALRGQSGLGGLAVSGRPTVRFLSSAHARLGTRIRRHCRADPQEQTVFPFPSGGSFGIDRPVVARFRDLLFPPRHASAGSLVAGAGGRFGAADRVRDGQDKMRPMAGRATARRARIGELQRLSLAPAAVRLRPRQVQRSGGRMDDARLGRGLVCDGLCFVAMGRTSLSRSGTFFPRVGVSRGIGPRHDPHHRRQNYCAVRRVAHSDAGHRGRSGHGRLPRQMHRLARFESEFGWPKWPLVSSATEQRN